MDMKLYKVYIMVKKLFKREKLKRRLLINGEFEVQGKKLVTILSKFFGKLKALRKSKKKMNKIKIIFSPKYSQKIIRQIEKNNQSAHFHKWVKDLANQQAIQIKEWETKKIPIWLKIINLPTITNKATYQKSKNNRYVMVAYLMSNREGHLKQANNKKRKTIQISSQILSWCSNLMNSLQQAITCIYKICLIFWE